MSWTDFHKHVRLFPPSEQERIKRAFELGEKLHDGQKRRSGEPYFIHPVAVASMLVNMGADADSIIAALLHDTAEDTPASPQEIGGQFNGDVVDLIDGLTKLSADEFAEQPRLNEQVETLRKMFTLMEKDVRIMVIKLVDRLHNMRTAEFLPEDKRLAIAQETADVFVKIADRLSMQDIRYELEELALAILDPTLHTQLRKLRDKLESKGDHFLTLMHETMQRKHTHLMNKVHMHVEHKIWDKVRAQYQAHGAASTGVSAITIVLVCPDRDTCYRMLGMLHETWQGEAMSFLDHINSPAHNGYQGLHTTVILPDGTRVRCKIRTVEMDEYAHRGVTLFCFRPDAKEVLGTLLPWTKRISPLAEDTKDRSEDFWQSLQSDILGETIAIHTSGERAISVPKGSTVLDGAFYCFGQQALRLKRALVNGKTAPLHAPLKQADTLMVEFGKPQTVQRDWLRWTQTGFASSAIRSALSQEPDSKNIETGKVLLQNAMDEGRIGFLEEFNQNTLKRKAQEAGYASLDEAFIAVATGRLEPLALQQILFHRQTPSAQSYHHDTARKPYRLACRMLAADAHAFARISAIADTMQDRLVRYSWHKKGTGAILKATIHLNVAERERLYNALQMLGVKDIVLTPIAYRRLIFFAAILLTTLWGLDPVFARFLIQFDQLTAIDFTLLRFWSLALVFSAATYISRRRSTVQPLNFKHPLLWMSAILMMLLALATYASLQSSLASHYETVMAASSILVATAFRTVAWKKSILLWILFACSMILLAQSPSWNLQGASYMIVALVIFALFLVVSNRYMQSQLIAHRTLEYYTAILIIGSLCTIPLFLLASPMMQQPAVILHVALFSIIFIGCPYYLYYEVPPKREMGSVLPFAFVMLSATFVGEFLFTRHMDLYTLLAGSVMIGAAFVQQEKQRV